MEYRMAGQEYVLEISGACDVSYRDPAQRVDFPRKTEYTHLRIDQ